MSKKCSCTNAIADDQSQCEWCECPEVPMYKINYLGDSVLLCFLNLGENGVEVRHSDNLSVLAPSRQSGEAILADYLNTQKLELVL